MICPDNHKINRKEYWRRNYDGKLLPSSGEDICVTCGHRGIYDQAYLNGYTEKVRYYNRINGEWNNVDSYGDLLF